MAISEKELQAELMALVPFIRASEKLLELAGTDPKKLTADFTRRGAARVGKAIAGAREPVLTRAIFEAYIEAQRGAGLLLTLAGAWEKE